MMNLCKNEIFSNEKAKNGIKNAFEIWKSQYFVNPPLNAVKSLILPKKLF